MTIKKLEFEQCLLSVNACYDKQVSDMLPAIDIFSTLFVNDEVDMAAFQNFSKKDSNIYFKAVAKRMLAIFSIRHARHSNGKNLDFKNTWNLVFDSILTVPISSTISSIGSQGFLSIPLSRTSGDMDKFEFIRLHIWDNSLSHYINQEACRNFSIHSHAFYARSWIICGKVINDRYKISETKGNLDNSLFTIEYNKTINEVNQHTSNAINTGNNVQVDQLSHEEYMQGSTYEIDAGDYHSSGTLSNNGLSATFFSFTAENGRVDKSFVVGPNKLTSSEINRKMHIDPTELLKSIDKEINK